MFLKSHRKQWLAVRVLVSDILIIWLVGTCCTQSHVCHGCNFKRQIRLGLIRMWEESVSVNNLDTRLCVIYKDIESWSANDVIINLKLLFKMFFIFRIFKTPAFVRKNVFSPICPYLLETIRGVLASFTIKRVSLW